MATFLGYIFGRWWRIKAGSTAITDPLSRFGVAGTVASDVLEDWRPAEGGTIGIPRNLQGVVLIATDPARSAVLLGHDREEQLGWLPVEITALHRDVAAAEAVSAELIGHRKLGAATILGWAKIRPDGASSAIWLLVVAATLDDVGVGQIGARGLRWLHQDQWRGLDAIDGFLLKAAERTWTDVR